MKCMIGLRSIAWFGREGMSKSRIAEWLGMSRNTVARLLSLDEPPRYRRKPRGSKLDPYKGSIGVMLERDPRAPARVILERLRREGYDGGITILKDYLAGVRPPKTKKVYQRTSYLPAVVGSVRLVASAGVGSGGWGRFPEGVWAGDYVASFGCSCCGVSSVLRQQLISARRCGGRSGASVVSRRGWCWIGIRRSWCRSPGRRGFMTRWRPCSERCGSAPSSCCPAGRSPRARSSGQSAI